MALYRRALAADALVSQLVSDADRVVPHAALHGGAVAVARTAEVAAVAVDDLSLQREVDLAVVHGRRCRLDGAYQLVVAVHL